VITQPQTAGEQFGYEFDFGGRADSRRAPIVG
jgi:hypothetical protein